MRLISIVVCLLWSTIDALAAQQAHLGSASFPNSGAPSAQPDFIRGLLLLHSFEYEAAATAFQAAEAKDPSFTMAYWGEAMTYTHPIWNQQDTAAARAALRKLAPTAAARAERTRTPRERDWLGTVEVLYGEGAKAHRDTLYQRALAQLAARYPNDDEARLFDALALMGLSQGVRDVPTYERAGAMALDLFKRYPDHPGAAHYVIHAFDDPTHAARALPAARAYSKIAPDAAHAQHMTTHIFLALGMWPEVVSQNIIASGPDTAKWVPGHYTDWLSYGYLQQGDTAAAATLLRRLHDHLSGGGPPGRRAAMVVMIGEFVVNAERWNDPALSWPLETRDINWLTQVSHSFVEGYAAVRRGEVPAAQGARAKLEALSDSVAPSLNGGLDRSQAGVMALQLRALLAWQYRDTTQALVNARRAAAVEDSLPAEFGPPTVVKPSHELLGELLLSAGRPAEAARSFERALALAPGRRLSLRGLAEANRLAGH